MNFLAHAYLSFNNPAVLTGNMISDFVKGKHIDDYSGEVLAGILLHRSIDAFTDVHPDTKLAKAFFKEDYRLYASPIVDVIYDYFVANDPDNFTTADELFNFSQTVYDALSANWIHIPEKFRQMFPYMKDQNWLYNYRTDEGIRNSLMGLHRRAKYMPPSDRAFEIFLENKSEIEVIYRSYFTMLKKHAEQEFTLLLNP